MNRNLFFIFWAFILIISVVAEAGFVLAADEAPKYNFASVQGSKELKASPGEIVDGKIYFYNINGNKITHVALKAGESSGLDVEILPALQENSYETNGEQIKISENFEIEPDIIYSTAGDNSGEFEWIKINQGHVKAKTAVVRIKVPDNAQVGDEKKVIVKGIASWLGQQGNIAFNQEREFEFDVKIINKNRGDIAERKTDAKLEATAGITGAVVGIAGNNALMTAAGFIGGLLTLGAMLIIIKKWKRKSLY